MRVVNWPHDIQVVSRTRAARVLVLKGAILFQGGRFIFRSPADLYRYRFAGGESVSIQIRRGAIFRPADLYCGTGKRTTASRALLDHADTAVGSMVVRRRTAQLTVSSAVNAWRWTTSRKCVGLRQPRPARRNPENSMTSTNSMLTTKNCWRSMMSVLIDGTVDWKSAGEWYVFS